VSPILDSIGSVKAFGWGKILSNTSYESIATESLSSAQSTVIFSSIPSTYTHLQIRGIARVSNSGTVGNDNVTAQFNSDTGSNYDYHFLLGNGSSPLAGYGINQTVMLCGKPSNASATVGVFGSFVIDILDYANTNKYKTVRVLTGVDNNGSGMIFFNSNLWRNTNAITSISFIYAQNFAQYSHFALYGIKGA
jgi:hypothetical protein